MIYCKDHYNYNKHNCEKATEYDHQVPFCPLCNKPVSFKYGDQPDINMNRHIEQECTIKQKSNKIYTNKCSMVNCKNREAIELICNECRLSYCLKHRHTIDHNCSREYSKNTASSSSKNEAISLAGAAAMQRINNGLSKTSNFVQKIGNMINTTPTNKSNQNRSNLVSINNVQGGLNEDEALTIAIQQSLNDQQSNQRLTANSVGTRNSPIVIQDEDEDLARALELSKREYERNKEKCSLS